MFNLLKHRRRPCPAGTGEFHRRRKTPSETGMGKPRVAAELGLRRFFEHDDLRRACLFSSDRRLKGGAAAADYDYGNVFSSHDS
jgi:hypothetical protein